MPARYKVGNLPDIRQDLCRTFQRCAESAKPIGTAAERGNENAIELVRTNPVLLRSTSAEYISVMMECAKTASLFYVTSQMCNVMDQMIRHIPNRAVLTQDALPDGCLFGMVVLEKPVPVPADATMPSEAHNPPATSVLSWRWYLNEDPPRSFGVAFETFASELTWTGGSSWRLLDRIDQYTDRDVPVTAATLHDRRLFVALANLCSTRIAAPQRVRADRAASRRAERFTGQEEPAYRRITLRRYWQHPDPAADPTGEHPGYSKRWVVSGHWRMQACGPRLEHRKPVYIEPHIKGPAWAPLDDSEVIRAVCR